jgi:hypothetical protein
LSAVGRAREHPWPVPRFRPPPLLPNEPSGGGCKGGIGVSARERRA